MDIPLAVVSEMIDLRTGHVDADRIIATAKASARTTGLPIVWIIIDTLNRALAGGDENSSKDMGAVITAVDRIQRATGAHCSLIHHVPVDSVEADRANDLVEKPQFAFQFEPVELARDELAVTTAPEEHGNSWADTAADEAAGGQPSKAHFGSTLTRCAVTA